ARNALDIVQTVDDQLAATPERLAKLDTGVLRAGQGLQPGALGCDVRAGDAVDHQLRHRVDRRLREEAVAESPAGHRVSLREAVEQDRPLYHAWERRQRDMLALVDQLTVYLVGQHGQVMLNRQVRDPPQFFARQ